MKDCYEEIVFQTDFVMDLAKDCAKDYPYNPDVTDIFNAWEHHKHDDVLTYRDQSFPSKFTGTPSPIHLRSFMDALDDSLETFMNKIKNKSSYMCTPSFWKNFRIHLQKILL